MSEKIETQRVQILETSSKLDEATKQFDDLAVSIQELSAAQVKSDAKFKEIQTNFDEKRTSLEKAIPRSSVVAAKPKLVQKKIQASYDSFIADFGCVTGGKCDDKK